MQYLLTLLQRKLQQNLNFVDETVTWKSKQTTWTRAEARTSRTRKWSLGRQAKPTLTLLFLFSTTYISPSYKQNQYSFLQACKKGKRKNSTINLILAKICSNKNKRKHEHEHQSKKEKDAITVFYQITSSIKHQQERSSERSANRDIRGPRIIYIYIYTLYKRKVHQTLSNARRQKDMVFCLFPVPCLSVCLQTFCRHPCFRGNCV